MQWILDFEITGSLVFSTVCHALSFHKSSYNAIIPALLYAMFCNQMVDGNTYGAACDYRVML